MKLRTASIQKWYRETFPEYFHGLQLHCAATSWNRSSIFVLNCSWQIYSPQSCSLSWITIFPLERNSMLWKEPPLFWPTLSCAPFIWCLLFLDCKSVHPPCGNCFHSFSHIPSQLYQPEEHSLLQPFIAHNVSPSLDIFCSFPHCTLGWEGQSSTTLLAQSYCPCNLSSFFYEKKIYFKEIKPFPREIKKEIDWKRRLRNSVHLRASYKRSYSKSSQPSELARLALWRFLLPQSIGHIFFLKISPRQWFSALFSKKCISCILSKIYEELWGFKSSKSW